MATARRAARVLVFDDEGRLLLLRGSDPARPEAGSWWFTPGGALGPHELPEDAARREVREETGIELAELGPVVLERAARFSFDGAEYEQEERFFSARVTGTALDFSAWTEVERRSLLEARWWSVCDLERTEEAVYPEGLARLARTLNVGQGAALRPDCRDDGRRR